MPPERVYDMRVSAAACSARGIERAVNQDHVNVQAVNDQAVLAVIADGLGGYAYSETASALAVSRVYAHIEQSTQRRGPWLASLKQAVQAANLDLWREAIEREHAMKTTLSALICSPAEALVAHVGDCRIYVVRAGEARLLTRDHSRAQEARAWRWLLRMPLPAAGGQARHALTRVLGDQPIVQVDSIRLRAEPGDRFILCSDGIWSGVSSAHIAALAAEHEHDAVLAHTLARAAQAHGSTDDASAVVVTLGAERTSEPETRLPLPTYQSLATPDDINAGVTVCHLG